jgi:ribosomal protein S18 acetylase RimI-like enzyme
MRRGAMFNVGHVRCRRARSSDASAIAALHADSWRRHYRGAYSDAFLDGDVAADRLAVWTRQLREPRWTHCTIVADANGGVVGFAHTVLDDDPTWGALLDNLHVVHALKGRGIGTRLMGETARCVLGRTPSSRLYLWVLEQNTPAQAFYEARGGSCVGRGVVRPPGGDPARLEGSPRKLRYVWSDPSILLEGR